MVNRRERIFELRDLGYPLMEAKKTANKEEIIFLLQCAEDTFFARRKCDYLRQAISLLLEIK